LKSTPPDVAPANCAHASAPATIAARIALIALSPNFSAARNAPIFPPLGFFPARRPAQGQPRPRCLPRVFRPIIAARPALSFSVFIPAFFGQTRAKTRLGECRKYSIF
jgi:hypothetical protein